MQAVLCISIITLGASSPVLSEATCSNWRAQGMEPLRLYLNQFQLSIIGQDAEEARAESKLMSLEEELGVNRLEINANTEYSSAINSLGSDEESKNKSTGLNLSISMPLSLEQSLSRQKQELSLKKAKSELALLRLRQQSEVMLQILKIHNLYNLVNNSKRKLTNN